MEIRTIRYFLAVAELGNISKAAIFLHTSQPNITRQIKDLEDEIGKPLFKRGKGMILTEEGLYLKEKARQIIDLFDRIESDIKVLNAEDSAVTGTIKIAGGESYAMNIIGKTFKKFHKKYPLVKLDIYSGATNEVIKRLEKGTIDFGILIEPAPITDYNFIKLPDYNTWGILMRKDSDLASRTYIFPEDLNNQPLLFSNPSAHTNMIKIWLNKSLNDLNIVATYNLIYNASILVKNGLGYAFTINKLINTSGDSELTFRELRPKLISYLDLVWKTELTLSKPAKLFLSEIKKEVIKQEASLL